MADREELEEIAAERMRHLPGETAAGRIDPATLTDDDREELAKRVHTEQKNTRPDIRPPTAATDTPGGKHSPVAGCWESCVTGPSMLLLSAARLKVPWAQTPMYNTLMSVARPASGPLCSSRWDASCTCGGRSSRRAGPLPSASWACS